MFQNIYRYRYRYRYIIIYYIYIYIYIYIVYIYIHKYIIIIIYKDLALIDSSYRFLRIGVSAILWYCYEIPSFDDSCNIGNGGCGGEGSDDSRSATQVLEEVYR